MKCKKCDYRANSIKAMGMHYRRKHPSSMKRHQHHERKKLNAADRKIYKLIEQIKDLIK